MLKHIFILNCVGNNKTDEKNSLDKTAENSTWCRKFCPPKNFVRRKFCPPKFCPIMFVYRGLVVPFEMFVEPSSHCTYPVQKQNIESLLSIQSPNFLSSYRQMLSNFCFYLWKHQLCLEELSHKQWTSK